MIANLMPSFVNKPHGVRPTPDVFSENKKGSRNKSF